MSGAVVITTKLTLHTGVEKEFNTNEKEKSEKPCEVHGFP
jgi:hypothetical protein